MENALIRTVDGKQVLRAEPVGGDVRVVLTHLGMRLEMLFSRLMRASFTRPWDYRGLDLKRSACEVRGGKLVVSGSSDRIEATVEFEFQGDRLHCRCSWKALEDLGDLGVAFVIDVPHEMETERVTLPMCLYNGNPSLGEDTVGPRFPKKEGASFVEEETRYPIPCANLEWREAGGSRYVSLFSIPDRNDAQWTLGFHRESAKSLCVMAASGSVSFNGVKDENYGFKNRGFKIESGYRELAKGASLTKSFVIRFDTSEQEGWGFRDIVRTGYVLFSPKVTPARALQEVIELKSAALDQRWSESETQGFLCVGPDNLYLRPPYFLWGWTGQSFRAAICSARQGFDEGKPELVERARRCVEFFFAGSGTGIKGFHRNRYWLKERKWTAEYEFAEERFSSRALGETFWNLSRLILLFRERKAEVPAGWVEGLCDAVDFFLDPKRQVKRGIPPIMWFADGALVSDEVSSAGTACASAAIGAYKVTGERKYLKAAEEMVNAYWAIGGDKFDTPFSKATLDSGCEDKEAAIPLFIGAADLYEITGDAKYKKWAEVTGDWLLTWVYFWDVPLRRGSILEHHGFRSTGWPSVSVENQHLDVFFSSYEMYAFGRKYGDRLFEEMGKNVFEACSHGISRGGGDWFFDEPGRQGEQFMQTNWGFNNRIGKYPEKFKEHFLKFGFTGDVLGEKIWAGGYNPWDTTWITVMVLEAALNFKLNK